MDSAFLVTPLLIGLKPTAKAGRRIFVQIQAVAGTLKTGEVRLMMRLNNEESGYTCVLYSPKCSQYSIIVREAPAVNTHAGSDR